MKIVHFRIIFNPLAWSSVINLAVNISFISAVLFSLVLFELCTKKLSWEIWHKWIKINSEVATIIKRKRKRERDDRDRGSEEVNRQSCSCMRRILDIPVIKKIVKKCMPVVMIVQTIVLGLWPAGNT